MSLRGANKRVPGAHTYGIMRAKFIDQIVLGEATAGLDELILLGTRARLAPLPAGRTATRVRMFVVDHPASQASKRIRVRGLLAREPDHVSFVKIDFTRDDLGGALAAAGHCRIPWRGCGRGLRPAPHPAWPPPEGGTNVRWTH
ncbi:MAG TPA: class I SAM-dependent methyltransferase [Solirubrobacteraceae bacterium]